MSVLKVILCSLALALVRAHISMDSNGIAPSGGYFRTNLKIPHGKFNGSDHMYTTRIVMEVPPGVRAVKPEAKTGWDLTIETRDLNPEEQYLSHGKMKTKGPAKITWKAQTPEDGLHNEHLMMIGLQIKFGCTFNDPEYHSTTGTRDDPQPHTTWWKVTQISSNKGTLDEDHVDHWTNAPHWANNDKTGEKPCPYIYIHAGDRCTWPSDTGSPSPPPGGMMWMGSYIPEDTTGSLPDRDLIMAMIDDALEPFSDQTDAVADLKKDTDRALTIGIVALALSATAIGFLLGLCLFRVTAATAFAEVVAAVPLTTTISTSKTAAAATGLPGNGAFASA